MKTQLVKNRFPGACWGSLVMLGAWLNVALEAQPIELISIPNPAQIPAAGGGGDSLSPIISPDGRYVLYASTANNLSVMGTTNPVPAVCPLPLNLFLRDRTSGTTILVSANSAGTGGGNDNSWPVALSTNGQYVLFESNASNLVPSDTNNAPDVFVRDLANGLTLLVSVATNGSSGNGISRGSAMTPDGRYVTFISAASTLVPGDTNRIPDVFVRDLQAGSTELVSVGAQTSIPRAPIPTGSPPDITPDGRYVVFSISGINLVPGVATANEIYVRDLLAGTTYWASSGARAAVQAAFGATNDVVFNYALSADGQFVAYEACPASPVAGLILRYNLLSGSTELVYTNATAPPLGENRSLDMTPDGRFIAFVANTNGLFGTNTGILVWDGQSGTTSLASGDTNNGVSTNSLCAWPTLNPSGRFVAFLSSGVNLVTNALAGDNHLYVRDLQAGTTTLVDADTNGVGTVLTSMPIPSLSADGRLVAFESPDGNLVPSDSNGSLDVFVRDLSAGATELVSSRAAALPSLGPHAPSTLYSSSVSSDGRYVAFASEADNLVANDTNGCRNVFVRDRLLGTNILVSVSTNNAAPGDNLSSEPALSADGRYVVFTSSADNLVAGDTNKALDVFVRDLGAGATALVSVNSSGTGPGNNDSYSPLISANARYVVFRSKATDLASGSFAGGENLFYRDLQSGTTHALTTAGVSSSASMTPDGRYVALVGVPNSLMSSNLYVWDGQAAAWIYTNTSTDASAVAFSPDGRRLVYTRPMHGLYAADLAAGTNGPLVTTMYFRSPSRPGLRFSADGRYMAYAAVLLPGSYQVYLYDFQTGTNLLVSRNFGPGLGGYGNSDSPDITPDGRFVVYHSGATNIVPGVINGTAVLLLYDQQTGANTLLGISRLGGSSADNCSWLPLLSGNGQTLVFESWASDLVGQTVSFNGNVFAFNLYSFSPTVPFQAVIAPDDQSCWLTWPVRPGETYRVQFKNSLSDPQWQDLGGSVTVLGNVGYLQDPAPATTQRFYRIAAF